MTTPAKSALDEARERLEAAMYSPLASSCSVVKPADLRLVLDALKEAELSRDNLLKAQDELLEQIEIQGEMIEVLKERAQ